MVIPRKLDIVEICKQTLDSVTKSDLYNLLTKNYYKLVNWVHSDLIFTKNDCFNNHKGKIEE